jgi:type II secretion system protein D
MIRHSISQNWSRYYGARRCLPYLLLFFMLLFCQLSYAVNDASVETIDDGKIDFNLRKAKIEQVLEFISKHTGKPVVPKKDIKVPITVVTPGRITPMQALDLIYEKLRMEGFVVIESEDYIQIVPLAEVKEQDILTISGIIPPAMRKQKSRVIRWVLALKIAKPSEIEPYLKPLMGKHALLSADVRTNKIMITDTVRNIERYEKILSELDTEGFDQSSMKVIPLDHADAGEVAQILKAYAVGGSVQSGKRPNQQRHPQQKGGKGQKQPTAEPPTIIVPDSRTNSVIVVAPKVKMVRIEQLIAKLDHPSTLDIQVNSIDIKYADADDVYRSASRLIQSMLGRSKRNSVEIMPAGTEGRLLVLASKKNFKLVEDIVKQLDTKGALTRDIRTYVLEHLDANDTASELDDLYGNLKKSDFYDMWDWNYANRRRDKEKEVKFVPVPRSNAVMVFAPSEEFKLIETMIKKLDKPIDMEEVLPRIYNLTNSNAQDVEKILNSMFGIEKQGRSDYWRRSLGDDKSKMVSRISGKIKFSADKNTNSILAITNNKGNYAIIDQVIKDLDKAMPHLANVKIFQLEHAEATPMADTLNSLFSLPVRRQNQKKNDEENVNRSVYDFDWGQQQKGQERPISSLIGQVRFVPDTRTNSLLVTTSAHHYPVIEGMIKQLDKEEPQVLIKVRIVEVKMNDLKKKGVRWSSDPSVTSSEEYDNTVSLLSKLTSNETFGDNGIIDSNVNINLVLQLLEKNLDSRIVLNPVLCVRNNQEGKIFVGKNIPRLTRDQTTPEGSFNRTFSNEDIGVTLVITPHINNKGKVVLKVQLKTDQMTGEMRFNSDVLQKREYNTEIALDGGETMVLGGIKLTTQQDMVRKVPLLGDIPFLNSIFKSTEKVDETTDLYAFITPEIISTTDEARAISDNYRHIISDMEETEVKENSTDKRKRSKVRGRY